MNRTKRKTIVSVVMKILFTLFLLFTIVFIFYHSSRVGEVSGAMSQRVMDKLNALLSAAGISYQLSHLAVRKLGHLAEYILLGFWLMLTLRVYTGRVLAFISWPLLFGLGLAVADEFLQQFVPGRTSSVTDVVIDFCGILLGLVVALFIVLVVTAIARSFTDRSKVYME